MDEKFAGQKITTTEINDEIKSSFIDYAMSVIVDRALPDVRDGLKPVHRRILYAMYEDNLTYNRPFRKSATTVGNVLGHYHPHGDAAVYNAMVRLAQPFSMRYPLVEGQGNFGNVDGDGAAAYRYTEARMAKMADEMLSDIDKDVVDFMPNFDNKLKEPKVLPARFPNLLVNGSIGIAVGMATNIPPHNLNEVIDGTVYLIDNPECEVSELMNFIKGPDFPTYGTIYGTSGIYQAYMTGRGRVLVRAKADFEEKNGRTSIIISEIPYQVNKSALVTSIAELVKDKRVDGITDIRDESGRAGMRIVIDVRRDANPSVILNLLYKYTQLQDTFAINMLALVNGEPKILNLKQVLNHYIKHQLEVVERRVGFELDKAKRRAHIVEGLKIAIDNIEEVIRIIRASKSIPEAKEQLISRFDISDIQSQEIVQMPLGRLSGLEIDKLLEELDALHKKISELEDILASETKIAEIVKSELLETKRKFGDERRTKIEIVENEILIEDLIERQTCVVTISHEGYIKRLPAATYSAQRRGGKGIVGMNTKEEDFVQNVFVSSSHNYLMMFSSAGKVFVKKCYEIPEASRTAKGTNLINIIDIPKEDSITAYISVKTFSDDEYLTMITKKGIIKKTKLSMFRKARRNGLFAINLDEGDELLNVLKTDGKGSILIATHEGQAVHFDETRVRPMGRTARGVKAITLRSDDYVVGAVAIDKDETRKILTVTENGFGKRCEISDFPIKNRGGKGMICQNITDKTGLLNSIVLVNEDDDIMLITTGGTIIRTRAAEISVYRRTASGVTIMRTNKDSLVSGVTTVPREDDAEEKALMEAENDGEALSAAELEDLKDDDNYSEEESDDEITEEDADEQDDEIDEDTDSEE